jgi:hypothetical protein
MLVSVKTTANCHGIEFAFSNTATSRKVTLTSCDGTVIADRIDVATTTSFSMLASAFNTSWTTVPSGVYKVSISSVGSSTIEVDYTCLVALCEDYCDIVNTLTPDNYENILKMAALKYAQDCPNCNCDSLCTIYSSLTETDTNECNCGCSY